ncbi:MAG: low specificity L-threonine aldolase [Lachnospiraceae bacterium]|jgi:threonine aldolase|nr:low specificity L-threonine aldolase [Lachnospiraceae bacterium]
MIRFNCDYLEGAHPKILKRLMETNMEQTVGYGEDEYSIKAKEKIKDICGDKNLDVHFLVGGTQTNTTVISHALRPHQGVFAVETGHINCHETGAIEATGHKVIVLPGEDGKMQACEIKKYMDSYLIDPSFEHVVQPKMVYISQTTEVGSLYSKAEIESIRRVCDEFNLYLFLDGARLGYALETSANDMDIPFIAKNTDVFYIGGTKVGALFGEAVVISNDDLKKDFRYAIKQHGGMLAKGRLLGIQFLELFTDDLYFKISKNAIDMARLLKEGFENLGITFAETPASNQIFIILNNSFIEKLHTKFDFEYQYQVNDFETCVRFCTSWATTKENVETLLKFMKENI